MAGESIMYPTPTETAAAIAAMLKRSGMTRARVSTLTVKRVSWRNQLRYSFIEELTDRLADTYGIQLVELGVGGFGVIKISALESAKAITGKKHLSSNERKKLSDGKGDFAAFHDEAVSEDEFELGED